MKSNRQLFLDKIKINRRGDHPDSYLITEKVENYFQNKALLRYIDSDFHYISNYQGNVNYQINFGSLTNFFKLSTLTQTINSQNNILQIDLVEKFLTIPILSNLELKYINCQILNETDYFVLDTPVPVCQTIMNFGETYASNYILNDKYGMYLESHNTPHIHMPLTPLSKGVIILGVSDYGNNLYLGAFRIPIGKALYTPPNIIHNDCYLNGLYRVFYTISHFYKKLVIKNKDLDTFMFKFIEK